MISACLRTLGVLILILVGLVHGLIQGQNKQRPLLPNDFDVWIKHFHSIS